MNKHSIVCLGSGQGSTIDFLCEKMVSNSIQMKALITENSRSNILDIAKKYSIPCHIIPYQKSDLKKWDEQLCQVLLSYQPQWIVLAGFLKKLGTYVLSQFKNKIINSHPSLLPEFSGMGMYGSKIHQAVIQEKKSYTGVSIHLVNEAYDQGVLLAQKKMPVHKKETALELEQRIKKIEKPFYLETLLKIFSGEISISQ